MNRILITIFLSLKIIPAFAFSLNCSSKGQDLKGKFAIDLTLDKFQNLLLNMKSEGQPEFKASDKIIDSLVRRGEYLVMHSNNPRTVKNTFLYFPEQNPTLQIKNYKYVWLSGVYDHKLALQDRSIAIPGAILGEEKLWIGKWISCQVL